MLWFFLYFVTLAVCTFIVRSLRDENAEHQDTIDSQKKTIVDLDAVVEMNDMELGKLRELKDELRSLASSRLEEIRELKADIDRRETGFAEAIDAYEQDFLTFKEQIEEFKTTNASQQDDIERLLLREQELIERCFNLSKTAMPDLEQMRKENGL